MIDLTTYNATVCGREEIHSQLIILRVRPDGDLFQFTPGQFAVLGLLGREPRLPEFNIDDLPTAPEKLIRRAYSIASSSHERQYLEFYLNVVPSGQLTPRLFVLRHGSRLFLSPKGSGCFTLDRAAATKSVILIATGTGLAPYMSMLRTLLNSETKRKFVVLQGARFSWDLGYRAELESLARTRSNLIHIPSITRPEHDPHFHGQKGRVPALLERGVIEELAGIALSPESAEVFLCGNPEMIRESKEFLMKRGFVPDVGKNPGTIHVEEYW